jgi:hypothetical protein
MRVFMRYGNREINLGHMPALPLPDDRVRFDVPDSTQTEDAQDCLTVGRRTFELRDQIATKDHTVFGLPLRKEWVCVLTSQETR